MRFLNLAGNSLGDDGARALAAGLREGVGTTALESLCLGVNAIRSSGVVELIQILAENETLTELQLQDNSFGDETGRALARALDASCNATLKNLNVDGNEFTLRERALVVRIVRANGAAFKEAEQRARCLLFCLERMAETRDSGGNNGIMGLLPGLLCVFRPAYMHAALLRVRGKV